MRRTFVPAAVLGFLLAAPAAALLIDNFEEGPWTLTDNIDDPYAVSATQSELSTSNVLGGVREVSTTTHVSTPATSSLTLSAGDDAAVLDLTSATTYNGAMGFHYDGQAGLGGR